MCVDEDPELFFGPHVCGQQCDGPRGCHEAKSERGRFYRISEAKKVCGICPEREACLAWALSTDQSYGVWGGKTERERRIMRRSNNGGNG